MSIYIYQLENSNWISDYAGPYYTLLLLAAETHQEFYININKFV